MNLQGKNFGRLYKHVPSKSVYFCIGNWIDSGGFKGLALLCVSKGFFNIDLGWAILDSQWVEIE